MKNIALYLAVAVLAAACASKDTKTEAQVDDKSTPVQTETPTVENTEERGEDIRKVCSRKAQTSPDMSRCWMEESERRGAKKFEAQVSLTLMVAPDGKALTVDSFGRLGLTPRHRARRLHPGTHSPTDIS